jgi:cystathionine gamma-synthase
LEHGADLVVHATTKYFGGHGDVSGGVVVARNKDDFGELVRNVQINEGAVPSPLDCWLVHRGIRTLPYRMRAHAENAGRIAKFLAAHQSVEIVHFPGLETHPGKVTVTKQMSGFGGMLSVQVLGDQDDALRVVARVQLFTKAGSLGSPESLIQHHASVEGPESTTPQNLLRLSIGLEHADDLIEDLDSGLR